jgi:transcription termination/antitermination protein NusA
VRMVVNELRGEKIDVVPWSENPGEFVANALQPAKVKEVRTDPDTGTALVIVPDYQLSLAIGKEGQNARLAARLTGWRIDIKSETQFAEDQRAATAPAPEAAPAAAAPAVAPEAPAGPGETPAEEVPDAGASSGSDAEDAALEEPGVGQASSEDAAEDAAEDVAAGEVAAEAETEASAE